MTVIMEEQKKIYTDKEAFSQIKDKNRKEYIKAWQELKDLYSRYKFEEDHPNEEAIISYFNHLRLEKKMATSSIWTFYSYINSVTNSKYGWQLQSYPRITMVIKGYEMDTNGYHLVDKNHAKYCFICKS